MGGRILISLALLMLLMSHTDLFAASRNVSRAHSRNPRLVRVHMHTRWHGRHSIHTIIPASGIFVQTLDGETLLDQGSERYFNPASVMKIATSFTALTKLGYDYRFDTPI